MGLLNYKSNPVSKGLLAAGQAMFEASAPQNNDGNWAKILNTGINKGVGTYDAELEKMKAQRLAEQEMQRKIAEYQLKQQTGKIDLQQKQQDFLNSNKKVVGNSIIDLNTMSPLYTKTASIDYNKPFLPDGTPNKAYQQYQFNKASKGTEAGNTPSKSDAGKASMIDSANAMMGTINNLTFNKDGSVNRDYLKGMAAVNWDDRASIFASAEAGQLSNAYEIVSQAITRTETGAAMAKEEIANTKSRFMPKPWDSDAVIKQKHKALNIFLSNASKYIRGNGANAVVDFAGVMTDAGKVSVTPTTQQQGSIPQAKPPKGFH